MPSKEMASKPPQLSFRVAGLVIRGTVPRILATLALGLLSAAVYGLDLAAVKELRPQATDDTCQSYALALALSDEVSSPFRVSTAKQLRVSELEIRSAIEAQRSKANAKEVTHEHWERAIEQLSSGQYRLVRRYPKTAEEAVSLVASLTGVTNANLLPASFSTAMTKKIVLVSFRAIEKSSYGGGHIAAVFGTAPAAGKPQPGLLILNPGVKLGDRGLRNSCRLDDTVGDVKYTVSLSLVHEYLLTNYSSTPGQKANSGAFLVAYIERKK